MAQIAKDKFNRQDKYREERAEEELKRQVERLSRQQKDQVEDLEAKQNQVESRHKIEIDERQREIQSLKNQVKENSSKIDQTMNSSKSGITSAYGPQSQRNLMSPFGDKRMAQTPQDRNRTYIMPKMSSPLKEEAAKKKREKDMISNLDDPTQTESLFGGEPSHMSKNQ